MIQQQFKTAVNNELNKTKSDDYLNARFAPTEENPDGAAFLNYKEFGGRFTDWTSSGNTVSNMKNEMRTPTNNTLFRGALTNNGVTLQNNQNSAWAYKTLTLANNGGVRSCVSDAECSQFPGTTCNTTHQDWDEVHGNQGNSCLPTFYPELQTGTYFRKNRNEGGIGKSCNDDKDCGSGYSCNNSVNTFGKNNQQTGYCAQTYDCGGSAGKKFLGYPIGASKPVSPPLEQNNNGKGYSTKKQCNDEKLAEQKCVSDERGKWFATYPGYCPIEREITNGSTPLGAFSSSSVGAVNSGIGIPSLPMFGIVGSSYNKPKQLGAFSAWNSSDSQGSSNMNTSEPMMYEMKINSGK